jgi:hypothetical protein
MLPKLTIEYNMENWRESTKGWMFAPYSIEGYDLRTTNISIAPVHAQEPFTKEGFHATPRNVSQSIAPSKSEPEKK